MFHERKPLMNYLLQMDFSILNEVDDPVNTAETIIGFLLMYQSDSLII